MVIVTKARYISWRAVWAKRWPLAPVSLQIAGSNANNRGQVGHLAVRCRRKVRDDSFSSGQPVATGGTATGCHFDRQVDGVETGAVRGELNTHSAVS